NIDKDTWPCRDCATFRRLAEEWRSAHSTTRREALFKEHGVRYSVLLKLPYWKPTRYVVVETMHNLFLGLFQRHCRSIFGMDIKAASQDIYDGDGSAGEVLPPVSDEVLAEARSLADSCTSVQTILGREVLEEIREDMKATTYPSYIGRAPLDVGSAGAGTLSAEQWRTFCTVNLPISLIRLWSASSSTTRQQALLRNFMHLVTAVKHATCRQASASSVAAYETAILAYLSGLLELFPDTRLVPNHHLAIHLADVVRYFGPPHSYWAFPFERFIRLLRNVNIN
ncbi:hypothetical protein BV20DRAFT_910907, partial [Pilatotrama ljubarskyi]